MARDILVLGAGVVGTCAALELQLRGHAVTLVDRQAPGRETSYGNAGIIQREAVQPYAFPRDGRSVVSALLKRGLDINYQLGALPGAAPALLKYWWASAPASHARISRDYSRLVAHSTSEHARIIALAGADDLVRRDGFRLAFRTEGAWQDAMAHAQVVAREFGVTHAGLDAAAMARAEPALQTGDVTVAGGLQWLQPWTVSDPGELVARYARLFAQRGGRLLRGDAATLRPQGAGWQVQTDDGPVSAPQAVIALGPWAGEATRQLGYRLPLFVKRGYHRHYTGGARVDLPLYDAERGYLVVPMRQGLRITTGAEIARMHAPADLRQITGTEAAARRLIDLGTAVEAQPWIGHRPCTADMKPVIGAAPRHAGLWFDFGHGHQGLTLGPASARLLADQMEGKAPYIDAAAFSPARFG